MNLNVKTFCKMVYVMKKSLIISIVFVFLSLISYAQPKKILLIGNSFIHMFSLPNMLDSLTRSMGDTIEFNSSTPGSYTLLLHNLNPLTITKIYEKKWDYVVLQEATANMERDTPFVTNYVFPNARKIDSMIKENNPCTQIFIFETWAKRYGDPATCSTEPWNCSYFSMQQNLCNRYLQLKDTLSTPIAPVASAWRNCYFADSAYNLWFTDSLHENTAGEYLAACVIFATIYRTSPIGASYISTLPTGEASFLQNYASHTVLDSLSHWGIGSFDPQASFTYSVNGLSIQFTNTSINGVTYFWNFGDTNTSTQQNPQHTYSAAGTYPVTLTVFSNCSSNSVTINVTV